MAAFDTSRPADLTAGRVSKFISTTFGAVVAWNDARVTRNSLAKLSARELDDIGLVPGDIDMIARKSLKTHRNCSSLYLCGLKSKTGEPLDSIASGLLIHASVARSHIATGCTCRGLRHVGTWLYAIWDRIHKVRKTHSACCALLELMPAFAEHLADPPRS